MTVPYNVIEMFYRALQRLRAQRTLKISTATFALCRWTILSIFIGSCVSPYTHADQAYTETLVIQGMITDEPGPYLISISKTIPIERQAPNQTIVPDGVSGATVTITDDLGNSEDLVEKSTGNYYTKNFQGIVGRSYYITVVSPNDGVYKSSMQKLLPVGDFDVTSKFIQVEPIDTVDQTTSKNGFEITMNSRLDPGQEGRVWWRTVGTYHVETSPAARLKYGVDQHGNGYWYPDPPLCAFNGYHKACTCCECWISDFDRTPRISDPRFITNNEIDGMKVGFVPATRRTLYDKYVFEIQQFSLSEDVYAFWKTVQISASNSSNLFQTPPPKTVGTITAQSPSSKAVLGYFAASSVKRKTLVFTRADVPYKILGIDFIWDSCLEVYRNATTQKPLFW